MYWIGRPLMPPLSLTQSKYAFATLPIVVKSTPGISMSMPPSLIGRPVAFLPVPRPQTDFVADALPEPTGAAARDVPAPDAQPASISARTPVTAHATPIVIFVDLMNPSVELRLTEPRGGRRAHLPQDLVSRTPLRVEVASARLASRRPPRADRLDGSRRRSRAVPASPGTRNPALGPSSGARGARERDFSTGLGAGTRDVSMPSLPLNVP